VTGGILFSFRYWLCVLALIKVFVWLTLSKGIFLLYHNVCSIRHQILTCYRVHNHFNLVKNRKPYNSISLTYRICLVTWHLWWWRNSIPNWSKYCICCFHIIKTTWRHSWTYCSFVTRVSQLKIWHFWVTGIEKNICRCTFNRYSVITQFAKLAAGEQFCHCCTHRKL